MFNAKMKYKLRFGSYGFISICIIINRIPFKTVLQSFWKKHIRVSKLLGMQVCNSVVELVYFWIWFDSVK